MHRHFEEELDHLRTRLIRMASLVDEQVEAAINALFSSDEFLARAVIERDRKVDSFDLKIDMQVERIFILAQPVASDLRFNMAVLAINNELERVGDIAVNIAERVPPLKHFHELLDKYPFREMADKAHKMFKDAIDSFIAGDTTLAHQIAHRDDEVDALERNLFSSLLREMQGSPQYVEAGAHLFYLLRHIERLADHATNIAEDVVFMVEAKLIKHHNDELSSNNTN
jgi:phosphate transport system protein